MNFLDVITYLESLTIMPKTMPGLEKMKQAVSEKKWFDQLDPQKIITAAGTNGKGTTCAVLEALLLSTGKKVGLYTSPHLIQTTERIRVNGLDISEEEFIRLFLHNKSIIEKVKLSHFEALTLMAADYFFTRDLDYFIFEVGLGGTFDATNVFPNYYSVITKLGLDHQNILGDTICDIAKNKFGIIKPHSIVVHHPLPKEVERLKKSDATWIEAKQCHSIYKKNLWYMDSEWGSAQLNLPGARAVENTATALTLFEYLGFEPKKYLSVLSQIRWRGRMQKISWPKISVPVYLSGDHNPQGIRSLMDILNEYEWSQLHLIVGVGQDKSCEDMFQLLVELPRLKLYLTETPFKGRKISDYPDWVLNKSIQNNSNVVEILNSIQTAPSDLVVVTGSLYLVGQVLSCLEI